MKLLSVRRFQPSKITPLSLWRTRKARGLATILLVGLVLWGLAHWLGSPAQGQLIKPEAGLAPHVTKSVKTVAPASSLSNDYFQLSLPVGYTAQPANSPPAGLLVSQTLIKSGSFGSLIINIAVENLPDGGLDGDPSYRLRLSQASRYVLSTRQVSDDTIQIANDTQLASVVAFWPHAGHLATISISSGIDNPASQENTDELTALGPLLSGWQWR